MNDDNISDIRTTPWPEGISVSRMRNNPIIVQKYGGACLETPAKIRAVATSLADLHSRGHRVVAIVSAQLETAGKTGLCRQPQIVDHDRNIVVGVKPDVARLVSLRRRGSRHETLPFQLPSDAVLSLDKYRRFWRLYRIRSSRSRPLPPCGRCSPVPDLPSST